MAFATYPKSKSEPYCKGCKHTNPANEDGSCSGYGYNGVDCQPQPCICREHFVTINHKAESPATTPPDFTEQAERAAQKIIDECYFEKVDQPYIRKRFAYLILSEFDPTLARSPAETKCDCKHEIEAANCPRLQECANQPTATFTEQARQLVDEFEKTTGMSVLCADDLIERIASFAAEAATQGQAVGIERAVAIARRTQEWTTELWNEAAKVSNSEVMKLYNGRTLAAHDIAVQIGNLSPDPSYLDRVRSKAATAALEQAARMLAKGSDGVGGDWEAAEAAAVITKPTAIGNDKEQQQ